MPRRSEPPERTCIATREARPNAELLRFVVAPDGEVVPDLKRTLPGRGAWVTAERGAVEKAERKRLFGRAFEGDVRVTPGLADRVDHLLATNALGALGLARKAGQVVTGFAKVEAALGRGEAIGLIHAREAAPDGVRKLAAAAERRQRAAGSAPAVIDCFTESQLDLALGRPHVIHAALLAGRAGEIALERCAALKRFRGFSPAGERARSDEADDTSPGDRAREDMRDE